MIKWKEAELGEYCDFQEGYVNPSKEHPEYFGGSVKWCRAVDINDGYIYHTSQTLTEEGFKSAKKSALLFEPNTIVISKSGTIGRVGIIKDYMCGNRATINIKPKNNADVEFIFYMLKSKQREFADLAVGSVQKNLYVSILEKIKFKFPSLDNQKKISSYISTIDKKIEINNQINRNLSEQLDSLYSELSTCQKWEYVAIDELADKIAMGPFGSNIKVSTFVERGIPIISGNHLRGHFLEEPSYNYITEEHAEKLKNSNVYPKDVIFTHAGNIGQVAMIPDDSEYDRYVISQRQFYLRCNLEKVLPEYVTLFFHSNEGQQELLSYANQVGVPSIAQPVKNLKKIQIPLPPIDVQREWLTIVKPMISLHQKTSKENKRLVLLRDSLLPKLMSGRLDVSELDI